MPYLPLLELTRGGLVESVHHGAIAVADATGRLMAAYGDPNTVVYLRSSAKPFQALPFVEAGGPEHFGFTAREIAIMCASHLGLDMHVETVLGMQAKISATENDLLCGTHPCEDSDTAAQLIRAGQAPTPNRHNCSGKHTGMLAYARLRGLPLADYINPQHGIQQTILATFAEMCGMPPGEVVLGVDGCSAPNFAVPLAKAATALARLADPSGLPPTRAVALQKIFSVMNNEPEMVRGPHGFDTELMRVLPKTVAAKGGAEGYQALAIAPGALGPHSPALGVAIKCADGAARAAAPVALEVLSQLEVVGDQELDALARSGFSPRQPVKNWRGLVAGEIRPCFTLTLY